MLLLLLCIMKHNFNAGDNYYVYMDHAAVYTFCTYMHDSLDEGFIWYKEKLPPRIGVTNRTT